MIVYQCIQAIDLFGLDIEGIYRLSGTASHINQLKEVFNRGS
jgi:Rho GTPase-activating protein RGD1